VSEAQELSSTTRRVGAVVDTESAQGPLDPFACRALRLSLSLTPPLLFPRPLLGWAGTGAPWSGDPSALGSNTSSSAGE
jgi:hypothetical protein